MCALGGSRGSRVSRFGKNLGQRTDELTDLADDFLTRPVDRLGQTPHDRAADDQAVGHRGELAHLVWPADPEADANGQIGLGSQPADALNKVDRQTLTLARDARDRDVIDEPRGRAGDLDRPLSGRRRRDELDQLEPARLAFCVNAADSSTGRSGTIRPSSPAVTASLKYRSVPTRWMIA